MMTNTVYDNRNIHLYTEIRFIGNCYWNLDMSNFLNSTIVPIRYIKTGQRDESFRLALNY